MGSDSSGKPLKILAFDEARFGLINWHGRRYCPKGFRPPSIVRRRHEWTYLSAAVDPTSGQSFCLYLPGMDSLCLEAFLKHLGGAYADHHPLVVLDGAPSHTSSVYTSASVRYVYDETCRRVRGYPEWSPEDEDLHDGGPSTI